MAEKSPTGHTSIAMLYNLFCTATRCSDPHLTIELSMSTRDPRLKTTAVQCQDEAAEPDTINVMKYCHGETTSLLKSCIYVKVQLTAAVVATVCRTNLLQLSFDAETTVKNS